MMSSSKHMAFLRVILVIAGSFTLLMSFPLAIPGVFTDYVYRLWELNLLLGLGGEKPFVPADGSVRLIINHAGVELVSLSILIIYASRDPVARKFIIYLTMLGRLAFAGFAIYYTFWFQAMQLFYIVAATDMTFIALIVYALYANRYQLHPGLRGPSQ
jgi:hypothetical protein